MQTITPFLWFDGKVEEAMTFDTSIFNGSKVENVSRMGGPGGLGHAWHEEDRRRGVEEGV